jgi:hypothetical protein
MRNKYGKFTAVFEKRANGGLIREELPGANIGKTEETREI